MIATTIAIKPRQSIVAGSFLRSGEVVILQDGEANDLVAFPYDATRKYAIPVEHLVVVLQECRAGQEIKTYLSVVRVHPDKRAVEFEVVTDDAVVQLDRVSDGVQPGDTITVPGGESLLATFDSLRYTNGL